MTVGNKRIYAVIFLAVFVMIFTIGVVSEVSLTSALTRAFLAGLFFTLLTWGIGKIIAQYVFPKAGSGTGDFNLNGSLGSRLDLTVSETIDGIGDEISEEEADGNAQRNQFTPLTAKQIDPQLNKIINNDPKKMADIVRKMGFEDE